MVIPNSLWCGDVFGQFTNFTSLIMEITNYSYKVIIEYGLKHTSRKGIFPGNADAKLVISLQACAFRDSYEKFKKAGAEVVGISGDDTSSHKVTEKHLFFFLKHV